MPHLKYLTHKFDEYHIIEASDFAINEYSNNPKIKIQKDDGKSPKRQKRIVFASLMIMCVFVFAEIIVNPLIPFLFHDSKTNMSVNSLSAI